MSDSSPFDEPSHPQLLPSTAAREAAREDDASSAYGKKHGRVAPNRPAAPRRSSPHSHTASDTHLAHPTVSEAHDVRPSSQTRARSCEFGSDMATSLTAETAADPNYKATTEIRAGLAQKAFSIHTDLLVSTATYFAAMQKPAIMTTTNMLKPTSRLSGPFFFPELDEFAFALFVRWIYGGRLQGPKDFHSMNHYLCLYVLSRNFGIETLENTVMDLVRHYYHVEDMTSPAFRLDYIYSNTKEPCLMRTFLVTTAAYRALVDEEEKSVGISDSIKGVLKTGGDLSVDYADALCNLHKNELRDVRKGDACHWHVHNATPKCAPARASEPWEND